ncbi:reverse transcriptase domain-containing protein, partial [Tanacetum coccineum]
MYVRGSGRTELVVQLQPARTIKEVQSLNGKLASLNRFLSKSAEKSLPLFKTLNKFIKKSDFHWTPEAEQAFKQLKQHFSELPLLVAPKPKEELIVYMSASYGAGPELNYAPMEKLVSSLVFSAKRLRRTDPGGLPCREAGQKSTRHISCGNPAEAFTYALRFHFTASNNEAEYEALIAGLQIAAQMGVRN